MMYCIVCHLILSVIHATCVCCHLHDMFYFCIFHDVLLVHPQFCLCFLFIFHDYLSTYFFLSPLHFSSGTLIVFPYLTFVHLLLLLLLFDCFSLTWDCDQRHMFITRTINVFRDSIINLITNTIRLLNQTVDFILPCATNAIEWSFAMTKHAECVNACSLKCFSSSINQRS